MNWYETPLVRRAPAQGLDEFGKHYRGGEWMPFYVPRIVMPQLNNYDNLLNFATEHGVVIRRRDNISPRLITPHQRVDVNKAKAMSSETLAKPILTSNDMFILDGHHRWYEHERQNIELSVYEIGLSFEKAIAFLFSFPETYSYGDGNEHPFVP